MYNKLTMVTSLELFSLVRAFSKLNKNINDYSFTSIGFKKIPCGSFKTKWKDNVILIYLDKDSDTLKINNFSNGILLFSGYCRTEAQLHTIIGSLFSVKINQ